MIKCIKERADKVIYNPADGHTPLKACEVIAYAKGYEDGAIDQMLVDDEERKRVHKGVLDKATKEMRKLNEKWKENLDIQRKMLIAKACKVVDDLMMAYISGKLTHDEVMEQCRKRMEE